MVKFESKNVLFPEALHFKIAAVALIATVLWFTGAPNFLKMAQAATLTNVSDTLTDSNLGSRSGHTIDFTLQSALNDFGGADKIFVQLDPFTTAFNISKLQVTDFSATTGITVVSACSAGVSEFTLATTTSSFTLTICATDSVATSTVVNLAIASSTSIITNPNSTQSYVIRVQTLNQGTATLDQADTRVAILSNVRVTASVDTSFTFTVSGLPSGTAINGVTTSTTTSATAIGFGTLDPTVNASTTAGQRLNVTTNAVNGFTVTVKEDQNLTSANGADIDVFKDGNGQATPVTWTYPAGTLGSENTYGHFGLTSSDDINANEFSGAKFVGNFASTSRAVFSHNGPSNGTTANIGQVDVAYKIAITSLQEAGTDYTNTLTYVATPVF